MKAFHKRKDFRFSSGRRGIDEKCRLCKKQTITLCKRLSLCKDHGCIISTHRMSHNYSESRQIKIASNGNSPRVAQYASSRMSNRKLEKTKQQFSRQNIFIAIKTIKKTFRSIDRKGAASTNLIRTQRKQSTPECHRSNLTKK